MPIKIDQKIVGYSVMKPDDQDQPDKPTAPVQHMHESIARPAPRRDQRDEMDGHQKRECLD